ncbi:hypothetical protein K492DRAFT_210310 [Lichtheimia hyalospora FSU 10163]|nr:hypothetical protein K492DRAFT_210310 [Lichtheimia hyalospora FSU 10163]
MPSTDSSSGSLCDRSVRNRLADVLHITGYHFVNAACVQSVDRSNNNNISLGDADGFCNRVSDKLAVVAKVSNNNFQLEREYYIIKQLYQTADGPQYLVRPLEYTHISSCGLAVAIYADSHNDHRLSNRTVDDLGTFLRLAIRCTDIMEFIHRHSTVHGQINMDAFRWDGATGVRLWNFAVNGSNGSASFEKYLTSEGWRKYQKNHAIMRNSLVYISPEQTGRTTYTADHRSDIYSLGIVFFVLLTGQLPFDGGPLQIVNSILSRKMPAVHDIQLNVPEVISQIIDKMVCKTPDDRYMSMHGVKCDLEECLERLTTGDTGIIPSFPLAQRDIASVFMIPRTVYGRQPIISKMIYIVELFVSQYKPAKIRSSKHGSSLEAYSNSDPDTEQKTSSTPNSSPAHDNSDISSTSSRLVSINGKQAATVVGIYGPGGIGKSTLFNVVQPLARKSGYITSTKFDSRNKVPYSGMIRLLSQALQQILSETEEEVCRFCDHLKAWLGSQFSNIAVLADLVPELKSLLAATGEKDDFTTARETSQIQVDDVEARLRFHNLYIEVFRAVSNWRMISIFIDDLHQADDPSVDLLIALLLSKINILVFMSYRDQEMNEKQSSLLENQYANIQFLEVGRLTIDAMTDFVCDTLHRPRDTTDRSYVMPLAELIHRKTDGNAFFAAQLLRMLERKKHIYFNWEFNVWEYDRERIEQGTFLDTMEADVAFMVARLQELPRHGQQLLKLASFVGDTFSWSTVKALMTGSIYDDASEDGSDKSSVVSNETVSDNTQFSGTSKRSADTTMSPISGSREAFDPISGLHTVIQEGYVMPIGDGEFKWSHDRITQAAGELVRPSARSKIHFKIAQHLMQEKTVDSFLVADHLLKCQELLKAMDDKEPYRMLLVDAGSKGRQSGAHNMAYSYYKAALRLGDPEKDWSDDHYASSLQVHINALALSFVMGDNGTTEELMTIIFKYAKNALDRKAAYLIQSRYHLLERRPHEGRDALLTCLQDLGNEKFLFKGDSKEAMDQEYKDLETAIERIGIDQIENINLADDPHVLATMDILEELTHLLYWTAQMHEMSTCATRIVNMALKHGMAPVASIACEFLALGYIHMYKKYAAAEKIAQVGIVLADRYGGHYEKDRTYLLYAVFIVHFNRHCREATPLLYAGTQHASSAGDRDFEFYGQLNRGTNLFALGHHLSDVLPVAEECAEQTIKWSETTDRNVMAMGSVRTIKALQGRTYWEDGKVFDGDDGFNDEHFITESCKKIGSASDIPLNWYQSHKIIAMTLYEHYEQAIELGNFCYRTLTQVPGMRHSLVALFYYSIALIARARNNNETMDDCIKQVSINQKILYGLMEHCRANYSLLWTLVEAELASLDGHYSALKAISLYEEAINQAREGGWYLELCVMHELAGAFYYQQGIYNAVDLYTSYGAFGKSRHLNSKYVDLLSSFNDDRVEARDKSAQTDPFPLLANADRDLQQTWSNSSHDHAGSNHLANEPYSSESIPPVTTEQTLVTLDIIDMASILKSSQVLASEVKFDALLKNMMHIILENSGADRGAIIVNEDKRFGIGAYGNQQQDEPIITYDVPERINKNSSLVSSQIIHHTIHTSESIFIADVEQDARFAVGSWFERVGKKSVICMPIIHKASTVGCLFIEGAVGIFTQRHITVLGLLCQQMGISLTNASLFRSVKRVTMANNKMIETQMRALEEARRSKEAADKATRLREIFLANMSHEIRTPFSGFYGMITLLSETELDSAQYDLVRTAKSSCEGLLQIIDDLLNFSKLQAGKVSLDLAPVHVEELIADVTDMLIAIAIQKRINVTYKVENDVPAVIMADANRLRQIIINLLGNAIKFTHKGEIVIRCSIDRDEKHDIQSNKEVPLLFEVVDTGIGISEEQQKVLFMPFSQVDGSTTRKYGGTGLGLSICLQLVTLMKGSIDVISESGKGSNFRFSIKVAPVNDDAKEFSDSMKALSKCLQKTRVLVADTHISTINMVSNFLPDIPLDGVSDYTDLKQETSYGVVIVGLLLAHKEGTLTSWETELQKTMKRAKVTVVMQYPLASGSGKRDIALNEPSHWAVEQEQRCQQQEQPFHISSYRHLDVQQGLVRMAVPLRRNKLLKVLAGFLEDQQGESPVKTPRPAIFNRVASSEIKLAIESIPEERRNAFKKMHILIAEDNVVAQKLLYKQLKRYGFNITCANNGAEAIAAWESQPAEYFRIAFFDHHMPKCDGVEATKTIRKMEKQEHGIKRLPIVALTADIQDSARAICVNAGMDG